MNLREIVHHPVFTNAVMTLILINAILIGIESYPVLYDSYFPWIQGIDRLILWAFTFEILLRMWVSRPFLSFFRDGWNLFDFIIVLSGHLFVNTTFITVLRLLRILRVLRVMGMDLFRVIYLIWNLYRDEFDRRCYSYQS